MLNSVVRSDFTENITCEFSKILGSKPNSLSNHRKQLQQSVLIDKGRLEEIRKGTREMWHFTMENAISNFK